MAARLRTSVTAFFSHTIPSVFWTLAPLPAFLHSAAWTSTQKSIEKLLNAPTTAPANNPNAPTKDSLTKNWRDSMQLQLNVVAVTVRVFAMENAAKHLNFLHLELIVEYSRALWLAVL